MHARNYKHEHNQSPCPPFSNGAGAIDVPTRCWPTKGSQRTVPVERLRGLLVYEPQTGIFTRRIRQGNCAAGSLAGRPNKGERYLRVGVDYVSYQVHRLAWLYMTGEWPNGEIDHINGDGHDNRWVNLRDVPASLNQQNQRRAQRNNQTGLLGVTFHANGFQASITADGKWRYIGRFQTPGEAHEAYLAAKRQLHPGNTL